MKLTKKTLWILGTLFFSAIAGIYFYLNIHNPSGTTIAIILAALALYFLFQTGQLYQKMWTKILVYLLDVVWIIAVLLLVGIFVK
ncbi:hypothetical protein [Lactobacillus ultunensis]|uniref:Uncharacterized protein n=1 Tax=Lactobacillus ultunensis DSM 16047 TaxID=525365 RepID=C2ENY5_9LACO|nr:hypothetical protein [Lactobacillus ultunensis]EEJ71768.1 hypothetical protein HMPREF0548_1381 [Lactobacillus ultunensis DSM 16047]KRL82207.1 hypothetical protein FC57_GL002037 [Lactobacillus ultunensis DSM 16047]QQP28524.1 hypothetical protein H4B44_10640 [Lactobacillus ultunensis]